MTSGADDGKHQETEMEAGRIFCRLVIFLGLLVVNGACGFFGFLVAVYLD